jgi:hypothetical protein
MAAWIDAIARPRSHTTPRSAFQVNSMPGAVKEEQDEEDEHPYGNWESTETTERKETGMLFG